MMIDCVVCLNSHQSAGFSVPRCCAKLSGPCPAVPVPAALISDRIIVVCETQHSKIDGYEDKVTVDSRIDKSLPCWSDSLL
jgi:hypothetical protein